MRRDANLVFRKMSKTIKAYRIVHSAMALTRHYVTCDPAQLSELSSSPRRLRTIAPVLTGARIAP